MIYPTGNRSVYNMGYDQGVSDGKRLGRKELAEELKQAFENIYNKNVGAYIPISDLLDFGRIIDQYVNEGEEEK